MHDDDRELREQFAEISQVPLPESVKQDILRKAADMRPPRRHRMWLRSLLSGTAAVTAAGVLVWGAWSYGGGPNGTSSHRADDGRTLNPNSPFVALKVAPISVGFVTTDKALNKGMVEATLTNMSTDVIQPEDVVGLLVFESGDQPDWLVDARWAAFVDPPKQPLRPGESLTWTFRPLGVPMDANGHFQGKPKLMFLERGFVEMANADVTWQKAPISISDVSVTPRFQWASGKSFAVNATLRNTSSTPIRINDVKAIVWFSTLQSDDWTQPGAVRFMNRLTNEASPVVLAPGAATTVHFYLIGPASLDLSKTPVHLSLIWG